MFHELLSKIPDKLQEMYGENRAPELWGTEELSPFFFDMWRESGLMSAFLWLVERQKEIGNPNIPPTVKASMNLAGSYVLALGVRPENMDAGYLQLLAFGSTLGLLFMAQGETVTSTSFAGDPNDEENPLQTVTHTMSGEEYAKIAAQYDSRKHRCIGDTIHDLH